MKIRMIPWTVLGGVYGQEEIDTVVEILRAQVERGEGFRRQPEDRRFEQAFAEHEGATYAVAINSCGTGLDLAMRLLGVGPGDEVITTPLTFAATAQCIIGAGAKMVLADIDPVTCNLDPAKAEAKITRHTKVILPVHMNSMPADIDAFTDLSKRTGVKIVYDAAHATGTKYKGRGVGSASEMSSYSFQFTKNMSTLGEGGMLTTDNPDYHTRLQRMKSFGFQYEPVEDVLEWGTNYRMTKLQAAVGLIQLKKVDEVNRVRNAYARYISEQLRDTPEIIPPSDDGTHFCPYHLYMLRFNDEAIQASRDDFLRILQGTYKVESQIQYPPLWSFTFFRNMGYGPEDTPIAAKILRQIFNVPIFSRLSKDDIDYIVWAVKESAAALKRR
jgi:perosamine synthetase